MNACGMPWFCCVLAVAFLFASGGAVRASDDTPPVDLVWTRLPDLPETTGYAGAFAGVTERALGVAGGADFPGSPPWEGGEKVWYDRVYVLPNPETSWKTGFRLPRPLGYGVSVATPNGLVMARGCAAQTNHDNVYRVVWRDGELRWHDMPPLPEPVSCAAGALVGSTIYIAGGQPDPNPLRGPSMRNFWAFDLSEQQPRWRALAPWPGPERFYAVAATDGSAFYLISGMRRVTDGDGQPKLEYLRDMYRYDAPREGEPGRWQRVADLPRPNGAAPSPAPVVEGRFLLLLGNGADASHTDKPMAEHPGFGDELLVYDTQDDRWFSHGRVPDPRVAVTGVRWGQSFVVPSGEIRPGVRSPRVDAVRVRGVSRPHDDAGSSRQ